MKNAIVSNVSIKKKKKKRKTIKTEPSVDTYHKIDTDDIKITATETPLKLGNVGIYSNIDTNETKESKKKKKKT